VVAAFEKVLNKEIIVPENHDVTGAIGVAILAKEERTWDRSGFKGFDLSQRRYEHSSFECKGCANLCLIRKVSVEGEKPLSTEAGVRSMMSSNGPRIPISPISLQKGKRSFVLPMKERQAFPGMHHRSASRESSTCMKCSLSGSLLHRAGLPSGPLRSHQQRIDPKRGGERSCGDLFSDQGESRPCPQPVGERHPEDISPSIVSLKSLHPEITNCQPVLMLNRSPMPFLPRSISRRLAWRYCSLFSISVLIETVSKGGSSASGRHSGGVQKG